METIKIIAIVIFILAWFSTFFEKGWFQKLTMLAGTFILIGMYYVFCWISFIFHFVCGLVS